MQSHVDCSFAAGVAGNEGVDFSVLVSDSGFKRVIVDCVLAAGDDSTGECQVVEMVPQVPGQMSMDGEEQEAPASLKIIKMA